MKRSAPNTLRITLMTAGIGIAALTAASLYGQGRGYTIGPDWWEPARGIVFPRQADYEGPDGEIRILSERGAVRPQGHPFFEPLGRNGRACITCHQPANAMGISVRTLRQRWADTGGTDPVFAAIDGSNCPDLPQAVAASHSLLLNRGLFRIALPWPPKNSGGHEITPEFRIEVVRDPTGCNAGLAGNSAPHGQISIYRRPRMVANFRNASDGQSPFSLMTDGREPTLAAQATTAALVHEQASAPPTDRQLNEIVEFEMQLFAAQGSDIRGGLLNASNGPALLGPENVSLRRASLLNGRMEPVSRTFSVWNQPGENEAEIVRAFHASVIRGSSLFFEKSFAAPDIQGKPSRATCATCHQASPAQWMDIGTTTSAAPLDDPTLPLFKITCNATASPHPVWGRSMYSQDPGRALITGKCADVGAIVMQQLRGLAARAPYFSNGSAADLQELVDFYDWRFKIGFTAQEKQDLVNFLKVL